MNTTIKYIGLLVVYRLIGMHTCFLITLEGRALTGLSYCERLKPVTIGISQGNEFNSPPLKPLLNLEIYSEHLII